MTNIDYALLQKARDSSISKVQPVENNEGKLICTYYKSKLIPGYKYKVIGGLGAGAEYKGVYDLLQLINQTDYSFKTHLFFPEEDSPMEIPGFEKEDYFK